MPIDPTGLNSATPLPSLPVSGRAASNADPAVPLAPDSLKVTGGGKTSAEINADVLANYSLPPEGDRERLAAALKSVTADPPSGGTEHFDAMAPAFKPAPPLKIHLGIETEVSNGFKLKVDPVFKHGGGVKIGLRKDF